MWITYLVFFLFLSLFYIGTGALMYKYPPKQVNNVLGYRTNMSMKNEETWKFANVYWAKTFFINGLILLAPSIIIPIVCKDSAHLNAIGTSFSFILLFAIIPTIVLTEKALKKKFDKDGNLK